MSGREVAIGEVARDAIGSLVARGLTVGTAESLTGGLVAAALTSVPGASAVVRGGIVAYAADLKASLLWVPDELLGRVGTVHPEVAIAMARGARKRLGADIGLATTGVAGPDAVDGHRVGTVHVALALGRSAGFQLACDPMRGPESAGGPEPGEPEVVIRHAALSLAGDRDQIRGQTVRHALRLLIAAITEERD